MQNLGGQKFKGDPDVETGAVCVITARNTAE
jgi:hypothetical protein